METSLEHADERDLIETFTQELIEQVNPVVRGWGHHYKRAPTPSCVVGATTTSGLTSESSSTNSMAGSCGEFGRIGPANGAAAAGQRCRAASSTANSGLSILSR